MLDLLKVKHQRTGKKTMCPLLFDVFHAPAPFQTASLFLFPLFGREFQANL